MPFEEGQDFLADLHRVPFKGKAAVVIGNGSAVGTKTIIHCCPKCSLGRVILILVARRACRRATPDAQERFPTFPFSRFLACFAGKSWIVESGLRTITLASVQTCHAGRTGALPYLPFSRLCACFAGKSFIVESGLHKLP
jgi:hypothetical protein